MRGRDSFERWSQSHPNNLPFPPALAAEVGFCWLWADKHHWSFTSRFPQRPNPHLIICRILVKTVNKIVPGAVQSDVHQQPRLLRGNVSQKSCFFQKFVSRNTLLAALALVWNGHSSFGLNPWAGFAWSWFRPGLHASSVRTHHAQWFIVAWTATGVWNELLLRGCRHHLSLSYPVPVAVQTIK